ncbi:ABC transporter ATP-binding protein [Winogradskyella flava]|uniref:ABC transporter ATP-binding protein n=1 Tax=Winogradskyella flava TaxID=1884876 RepID=UPI002491685E|nr:ABC transporter ATP-binding protein [Winogradskyella flava]
MKIVIKTIRFALEILPKEKRLKLLGVVLLLGLNSLLDLLGLGAILPVFSVLLEDNVVEKYSWARWIYDSFALSTENQLIIVLAIALFIIVLSKNLISLWIRKLSSVFALGLFKEFALKLHKYYYKIGFNYFKTTNSNIVVRNLKGATNQFAQLQVLGSLNLINEIIVLIAILVVIAIYNIKIFGLLIITVGPPFFVFYRWVRIRSIKLGEETNTINPIVTKNFFQTIYGYVDVKIMGAEESFRNNIKKDLTKLANIDVKTLIYNIAPTKVIETSLMLTISIIICFGIYYLPSKTDLVKLLGLFAVAGYRIMPSINRMMIAINGLNRSQWIFDILRPLINVRSDEKIENSKLNFRKSLTLKNIDFSYPDSNDRIFNNFNLDIKKGEVIGLVGPSGAGKTTLMNILLGFIKPTKGSYLIDDVILSEKYEASFYSKVGYVQQQVYIIDGSLAENIAFGLRKDQIDENKLLDAVKKANLWELVKTLEHGVDEMIGENGTKLSGGQRQRVGIARALYSESEILFFDEATSALDSDTEKEITNSINSISDGKLTIIIIAHRLSTLEHCDRIIEINGQNQ